MNAAGLNVAVVGSRSFKDYERLERKLRKLGKLNSLISGGAAGADKLAERYAREHKIKMVIHKPEWKHFKKAAGPTRNQTIVDEADVVVAFWDGNSPGTRDTIDKTNKARKRLIVYPF
jgi:hypothetical protein